MSKKGGYKIIDLKNVDLTTENLKIDGIYNAIESNHRKAIMLSGIVIDGVEKDDCYVTLKIDSGNYVIENVYGRTLTINDEDEISINIYFNVLKASDLDLTNEGAIEYDDVVKIYNHLKNGGLFESNLSDVFLNYNISNFGINSDGIFELNLITFVADVELSTAVSYSYVKIIKSDSGEYTYYEGEF